MYLSKVKRRNCLLRHAHCSPSTLAQCLLPDCFLPPEQTCAFAPAQCPVHFRAEPDPQKQVFFAIWMECLFMPDPMCVFVLGQRRELHNLPVSRRFSVVAIC